MSAWNAQYKAYPPNSNNPGYGAEAIRDLKTNLENILGVEHSFDVVDDISLQGQHLPGSAIIALDDDTSDDIVNHSRMGRLTGTTTEDADEVSVTNLQVLGDEGYRDVRGYNQVSTDQNQTITGEHTFVTAPILSVTLDDNSDDDEFANVGFVRSESSTTGIEPAVVNAGPASNFVLYDFNDGSNPLYTIYAKDDTNNLEELLSQIVGELAYLRAAVSAVATNNPFDQNLEDDSSPTFAGLTVNGTITADKVTGAVWG